MAVRRAFATAENSTTLRAGSHSISVSIHRRRLPKAHGGGAGLPVVSAPFEWPLRPNVFSRSLMPRSTGREWRSSKPRSR